MSSSTVVFNDLPSKAVRRVFSFLGQSERQKLRGVCQSWKNIIDDEFPIELVINPRNYERLFQCSNAAFVQITNLSTEYTGNVAFGPRLRSIQFFGKVLSSNVLHILRFCPDLESLSFSSLRQVLGIDGVESVNLPKATQVEIQVRPDQDTFSSDEIIIIGTLRQILFGSLETILITTGIPYWDEDAEEEEIDYIPSETSEEQTQSFTMSTVTPMSSISAHLEDEQQTVSKNELQQTMSESEDEQQEPEDAEPSRMEVFDEAQQFNPSTFNQEMGAQTTATQTPNTNLHVIINRAANFPNPTGSVAASSHESSRSSSTPRVRYNMSEFEARLFHVNLELLLMENRDSNDLNVFNDSLSQTRIDSATYFDKTPAVVQSLKQTVFFEFVRNNHSTLKNLNVRTRSDFTCFGNLNNFIRDISRVQFEEIDYSFGRTQMYYEYMLLRSQFKLKKLKMQILFDLWKHLMLAVENSRVTLTDLDIKVMRVTDERVDITPITQCNSLKSLKLLHFFEKESICRLPRSLNKLVINGPLLYRDMETWTRELLDLEDMTILLNTRGDKIDVSLYKRFLKMPKLARLTVIQCPMDLDAIKHYIDNDIDQTGLKFSINGPHVISDMPTIQYVFTIINPDEFNRDQVEVE